MVLGSVTAGLGGWIARGDRVGTADSDVFQVINRLPEWLEPPLTVVMRAGSLVAVRVTAAVALLARQVRVAADLLLLEVTVRRREQIGCGYPSGHAAVATARSSSP